MRLKLALVLLGSAPDIMAVPWDVAAELAAYALKAAFVSPACRLGLDEELLAPDDDADNAGSASAAPLRAADWYQDDDDDAEIPPERQLPSDFMW